MEPILGYCDLCVLQATTPKDALYETCKMLISLGYKAIAINYLYDDTASAIEPKKRKRKAETKELMDIIPPLLPMDHLKELQKELTIYHRLTITFSDPAISLRLNQSTNIRKYNLLAVLPTTQSAYQYACSTFDADIITFESTNSSTLKMNRKLYNQAINRGLFFELMYTPAIRDATNRKNIIHMSHLYHAYGKSKKIVITSWASEPLHVRGPYDIINLGLILGLSEDQARQAISSACRELLIRAEGRRHGKAIMFVKNVEQKSGNSSSDSDDEMLMDSDCFSPDKKLKQ